MPITVDPAAIERYKEMQCIRHYFETDEPSSSGYSVLWNPALAPSHRLLVAVIGWSDSLGSYESPKRVRENADTCHILSLTRFDWLIAIADTISVNEWPDPWWSKK